MRIRLDSLSAKVRRLVKKIAKHWQIVPVAIDVNENTGYVALVHNYAAHEPFAARVTHDVPFHIDAAEQKAIFQALTAPSVLSEVSAALMVAK